MKITTGKFQISKQKMVHETKTRKKSREIFQEKKKFKMNFDN